ncbi:uncharacterized protein LOC135694211 [Rhopilema esculentum]|uniref:uncharacterized protein LOC135694211 n=1 Tax=Rhopilema esculentum TaxID=499914 RepID=UPI0031DFA857
MSLLDELFGQILQSEESIRQRFEQLKEAHSKILEFQSKLKDAAFEVQSLYGTMAVKNHKLVEKEVELKWFSSRVTILKQKALESKLVKEEISSQIREIESVIKQERTEFIEETKSFLESHELSSNLESHYEQKLKRNIQELKERTNELQTDLETLDKCQSARKILDEKIDVANRSITSLIFEKDEKEEALQMAKKKADEALASKDDAMALPQKCNEFKRLSEELSNCQKRSEELSRRRRDLLSELYLCQQEFMKKDSYMKTIQSSTAISGSQAMKTGNDIGCAKGSSADESHSNRRVSLFKSTKSNSNYSQNAFR